MIKADDLIEIGKFQKTHALKGELNAILDIDPDFFEEGNPLIVDIEGVYVPFYIIGIRPKGSTSFLLKIDGIDNESEAKTFVNRSFYAIKKSYADFTGVSIEEIDNQDFAGYSLFDISTGEKLGIVTEIDDSTENVLFVVENDGESLLIPATDDFIESIDDENKTIMMSLPEGLIDINEKKSSND